MPWLHAVVDSPLDVHALEGAFWAGVLGWAMGQPWDGHPELRSFEPPSGSSYVHLQQITGAARIHLNLESDDPADRAGLAQDLGARLVAETDAWRTLISPGGLPFCVVPSADHVPVEPASWPGGQRSRLVQVCVDSPRARHDPEVEFWRRLLPGRWVDSPAHEFAGKWHDDAGSPLQLLFQRLGEDQGAVRAHLDLGTDDVGAEVRRLRSLGARNIGPGSGWHALRDPAGIPFCATANSPEQLAHRDLG